MIKFVLTGYKEHGDGITVYKIPQTKLSYPVYQAMYISEDLIFGRE